MAAMQPVVRPEVMEKVANKKMMEAADMTRPEIANGRLVQVFTNVNLGKGHDGLSILCEQHGIDVSALEPGQYVVFTNTRRDKVKVFAANNVVAYLKLPPGHFMSLETLALIPLAFKGTEDIEYDRALLEGLRAETEVRQIQRRRFDAAG